jgi:hypothetical protein
MATVRILPFECINRGERLNTTVDGTFWMDTTASATSKVEFLMKELRLRCKQVVAALRRDSHDPIQRSRAILTA